MTRQIPIGSLEGGICIVNVMLVSASGVPSRSVSGRPLVLDLTDSHYYVRIGFIYLLALIEEQKGDCLKDANLHTSVKIFEEYCNAGLAIVKGWLDSNPGDPSGVDTLLEKVYQKLCENEKDETPNNEDITFEL